jgi:hypothetical protein
MPIQSVNPAESIGSIVFVALAGVALGVVATGCAENPGSRRTLPRVGTAGPPSVEAARGVPTSIGIVRVRSPWYAMDFLIRHKFRDYVVEYEAVPGLAAKYFTLGRGESGRHFGGLYVWAGAGADTAFYTDAWRQGIVARRGVEPDLRRFAVTAQLAATAGVTGEALTARTQAYPATATLTLWPSGAPAVDWAAFRPAGLLRGFTVRAADGAPGLVGLWVDVAAARAATASVEIGGLTETWEAPVLTDPALMP